MPRATEFTQSIASDVQALIWNKDCEFKKEADGSNLKKPTIGQQRGTQPPLKRRLAILAQMECACESLAGKSLAVIQGRKQRRMENGP